MSDEAKARFPIKDLIAAGPNAAKVLVEHAVGTYGPDLQAEADRHRSRAGFDVEEHVDQLIRSQLMLARAEGAGAGLLTTMAEMATLATGPGAVAAIGTTMLADVTALAVIQVRLSLRIAAAYGHDMTDVDARSHEILFLHSLELAGGKAAGPAAAKAGQKWAKKLLERYLKGAMLKSLTSMFRLIGIRFTRAALIRGLPVINVPANATIADLTTRRTASKARGYYRALPKSA